VLDLVNTGYLMSSAVAASAGLSTASRTNRRFWLGLSVGLLVFGLLRIARAGLFLDYYLELELRVLGWYDHRRPLQIGCLFLFCAALFVTLARLRGALEKRSLTTAISAFYLLAVYTAIRASSLHWSDAMLQHQIGPVALGHGTQSVLLVTISIAALVNTYSTKTARNNAPRGARTP
jgi:hypothetical protein